MKKLAFVTTYDPSDVRSWSGTPYYMTRSFKAQGTPIECLGPLTEYRAPLFKMKQAAYSIALRKKHLRDRERAIVNNYAEQVARKLQHSDADIAFAPGTIPISYLRCRQPIAFWSDSTFAGLVNFYPEFSNLSVESIKNGNRMEQSALSKCTLAIYSSEWAAQTALDYYQVDSSKVKVVAHGANVEDDRTRGDVEEMINSRPSESCRLLFMGVDWVRKGGDVAFEIAKELNNKGIRTELTVVGCKPLVTEPLPDYVKVTGFINKGTEAGKSRIKELFARSHFLVLPTKADCTPMVLTEANSFGVPCLTNDVGGIASVVRNNINGRVFSVNTEPSEYCNYILDSMSGWDQYRRLALSSFSEYQDRLNWGVACKDVMRLLEQYSE